MALNGYTACKVFTATVSKDREQLGEKVTGWLRANPDVEVVDTTPLQSSDSAFHCITMIVFYRQAPIAAAKAA
jgi:hypothetical protein